MKRHSKPSSPNSVANHNYCRNNSDKNLTNFLEWVKYLRIFASKIIAFFHLNSGSCIIVFSFGL